MFEGLGLGTRLAFLNLPPKYNYVPFLGAVVYSFVTPLGMAIGLGVREGLVSRFQESFVACSESSTDGFPFTEHVLGFGERRGGSFGLHLCRNPHLHGNRGADSPRVHPLEDIPHLQLGQAVVLALLLRLRRWNHGSPRTSKLDRWLSCSY